MTVIDPIDQNKCMDCGVDLKRKKRHPVYSSRLRVLGYRCEACHEKSSSSAKK